MCTAVGNSLSLSLPPPSAHQSYHLWREPAWGPGSRPPLSPAGINFPHSRLQNPPAWSFLAPSSALMDVSGCMDLPHLPPPLHPSSSAPIAHPTPAGPDLEAGSPEHPPWVGDAVSGSRDSGLPTGDASFPCPASRLQEMPSPTDPGCFCAPSTCPTLLLRTLRLSECDRLAESNPARGWQLGVLTKV